MAMQIGKREQIVAGVIIAVIAIAAVHLLFFQEKAKNEAQLQIQRQQLIEQFNSVAKVPAPSDLDKYQKETVEDEQLLWKVVSTLDLLTKPPFVATAPLPTVTGANTEKSQAYHDMLLKRQSVEAQALVAARLERLSDMAKAFEAGEKWVGEAGLVPADAKSGTMKMAFLGTGENAWGLAAGVAPPFPTNAELWDAVDHVHEAWQVLRLLQSSSPDYKPTDLKYQQNLKALGLDLDLMTTQKPPSPLLPEFRKLMLARAIWQKKDPGEVVLVGGETLTLSLLKDMLTFEPPENGEMYLLYRQLEFLEHLMILARQSGVTAVEQVELPREKIVVTYDAVSIKKAKEATGGGGQGTGPTAAPRRIRGGQGAATPAAPGSPGAGGAMMPPSVSGAMMPPGSSGAIPGAPGVPGVTPAGALVGAKAVAVAQLVHIAYTSSNEASMRFLYAIASAPQYYKVESVNVEATKEEGQTKVWLIAQAFFVVPGISGSEDGLMDPKTFQPVPLVAGEVATGAELYAKKLEEMKARGVDEQTVMTKALADAGLPEVAPTPEPTPAGAAAGAASTPAVSPAASPAARGVAPGGPSAGSRGGPAGGVAPASAPPPAVAPQ